MKEFIAITLWIILIGGGIFYPMISYLLLYSKAKKKWITIEAKKTGQKLYQGSHGVVTQVEYVFNNESFNVEVYKATFSDSPQVEKLEIMVNPLNPSQCIEINKEQVVKNFLFMIFFGPLLIAATILFLIEFLN